MTTGGSCGRKLRMLVTQMEERLVNKDPEALTAVQPSKSKGQL